MNQTSAELEKLISRYLDNEATKQERQGLEALMRRDRDVWALVHESMALDREVGHALRQAMGRTIPFQAGRSAWGRAGQVAMLAAAACLALMVWLSPERQAEQRNGQKGSRAAAASWFAPLGPRGDVVQTVNPSHERPQVRLRNTNREWIIIPGERPGEYLLIEMDRVRTRAIAIQGDF